MKNILMLIALIGIFAVGCSSVRKNDPPKSQTQFVQAVDVGVSAAIIRAVDETDLPATPIPLGVLGSVKNNVAELTLALLDFLKVIVNLTPTESDNKIFGLLDNFINWIVPNFKVGGGKFT
jgi:uncharacterized protein YceK